MCVRTDVDKRGETGKNQILDYSESFEDFILDEKFLLKYMGFGGKCNILLKAG